MPEVSLKSDNAFLWKSCLQTSERQRRENNGSVQ